MSQNKKYSGKINVNNIDEWLSSTGFLFPQDELQLVRFNELYADYDFKIKDASIDVKAIIQGDFCAFKATLKIIENKEINKEIEELRMVARKGQVLPNHIVEKMKQKHQKNNNGEEQQ